MPAEAERSDELAQKTVSGLGWQGLAAAMRFVGRMGIAVVLARLLAPTDFGILGAAAMVTGFASSVTEAALGAALVQRSSITERHIRVCHTLSVLAGCVAALVLYQAAPSFAEFFRDARVAPALRVLALGLLISGFAATAGALQTRRLDFKAMFTIELSALLVGYGGVAIVLALLGVGYWSLVWGTLAQAFLAAALTYAVRPHSLRPLLAREEIRDLVSFGSGISLASAVNYVAAQGDSFVVGRWMGTTSLGHYARAYTMMELPLRFFGQALSRVLFPVAARVQDDPARFRRAFLEALSLSTATALACCLALVVLAQEIILTLYGDQWTAAVPLLQILGLFGVFRMSAHTCAAFLRARARVWTILFTQCVHAVTVIIGSWVGGTLGGVEGVAWAVGVAITVTWLLVAFLTAKTADAPLRDLVVRLSGASAPGIMVGAVLWALSAGLRRAQLPSLVTLSVSGLVFSILMLGSLIVWVRRSDDPGVRQLAAKLPFINKHSY